MSMENTQNKLMPVLVVLLIVASFFIGSLYTKVNMLEKGVVAGAVNTNTGGTANNNNAPTAPQAPTAAGPVDVEFADAPMLGNKNAKVALVEFTDYQCPFCGQLFTNTFPQIKKEYIDTGKVRYYVRDFPLVQIHPQAQKAAEAASCAEEQGKFWEMHDKLFANQTALQIDDLKKYAADLGLNTGNFNKCLDDGKYAQKVKDSTTAGGTYGVRGTPSTFVGKVDGNKIKGIEVSGAQPFDSFKTQIDAALQS